MLGSAPLFFWVHPFNLNDLDDSNGLISNGIGLVDSLGFSVSSKGDLNNDAIFKNGFSLTKRKYESIE